MKVHPDFDWPPKRINRLRMRLGESQAQFADRLGVTRQSVHNWESNKKRPSYNTVQALLEAESTQEPQTPLRPSSRRSAT